MQTSARNGALVGAVQVADGDEIMLISDQGTLVRTRVDEISVLSRNTQGVRLIRVREHETLVGIAVVSDDGSETEV
jgi:DNA gyrase subunit A